MNQTHTTECDLLEDELLAQEEEEYVRDCLVWLQTDSFETEVDHLVGGDVDREEVFVARRNEISDYLMRVQR